MLSAKTKQFQLDQLIEDFTNWQNATSELARENTSLNAQIRTLTKQVQIGQEAEKCAVEERNSLRSMVDKLQSILSKRCDMEDENRQLKEQIAQAKTTLETLEQEHKNQVSDALKEIEVADQMHKQEIIRIKEDLQQQTKREVSLLEKTIQEKDGDLQHLQKQLADMARDKHTEIVKLRLEYDAKLLKLQKSNAAKTQTAPSSHFNSDIFRKKLQAAKSESEKDIAALKERIAQLERQLSMASQTQHDFRSSNLSLKRRRLNQN